MPRKPIAKIEKTYTAEMGAPFYDPDTGVEKVRLTVEEPVEQKGPHRGRPRKGTTRTRITRGRASKMTKNFLYVDAESMSMLDLSRQEQRVLSFLMSKIDHGTNEIRVTNSYIAKGTGMTQPNVSLAMKSLRERLIIISEGYGVWRINAQIAWTGEYKKWYPAAIDDEEPYWSKEDLEAEKNGPVLTALQGGS